MLKLIYLAGEPGVGKSWIFKRIRERLFPQYEEFKERTCRGIKTPDGKYQMIGVFDGSTFEGTDRLSMSAITDVLPYLKRLEEDDQPHVVYVEGARLLCERFLKETDASLVTVHAAPELIEARHKLRGDSQPEKFLQGQRTKITNIEKKFPGHAAMWLNEDKDSATVVDVLCRWGEIYHENHR